MKVSLNAILKVRSNLEPGQMKPIKIKEIVSKNIPLTKGEKIYSIDDIIKIPSTSDNPSIAYKKLDSTEGELFEKFQNCLLYPSCYGGKLNCEYTIRVMIEMGSLFSTNEFLEIPLDFYEPKNNNNNINSNNNVNQFFNNLNQNNIIETPLGNNPNNNSENKISEDIEAPPSLQQSLNINNNFMVDKP